MVHSKELFTLEELRRTVPGIDGVPNEILTDVIAVYPEILLETYSSYLRKGRFFDEWKGQRLDLSQKRRETSRGCLIL